MNFSEQLNRYLEALNIPASRLSEATGIPAYTISKYRSGTRLPEEDSETVRRISDGIQRLASEQNKPELANADVFAAFNNAILSSEYDFDFETLRKNFDMLLSELGITQSEIAGGCGYSRTTMFSLLKKQARIRDPRGLVKAVVNYTVENYNSPNDQRIAARLTSHPEPQFEDISTYKETLTAWLSGDMSGERSVMQDTLKEIDAFDLNEYLKGLNFGNIHIPPAPIKFTKRKEYRGMKGLEEGVVDFLKTTVLSRTYKDMILYSDFPMSHLIGETDVPKLWMKGLALALIKGHHVKTIHYIDRPFKELMVGMQAWLPMYMTGQVTPLYIEADSRGFHNCIMASGGAVLTGSSIADMPDNALFRLYRSKHEIEREYHGAESFAGRALPLMEIYTKERKDQFYSVLLSDGLQPGCREAILSAPPIYTISGELLDRILTRNRVPDGLAGNIRDYVSREKKCIEDVLKVSSCKVRLTHVSEAEFEKYPVRLSLSRGFFGMDLSYTYAEYKQHISETVDFTNARHNYSFSLRKEAGFRNIQITTLENIGALVSKNKAPEIHFIVRHPKLIQAVANIVMMIYDAEI